MIPSAVLAIFDAIFIGNTAISVIYLTIKTVSIIVNITTYLVILLKIGKMATASDASNPNTNLTSRFSLQAIRNNNNPVYVLAMRLQYYCIVQTLTRLGASWYQLQYGFGATYHEDSASTLQTISLFSEVILTPSAGIGYLIVFLCIQPDAWKQLKKLIKNSFCCCLCVVCSNMMSPKNAMSFAENTELVINNLLHPLAAQSTADTTNVSMGDGNYTEASHESLFPLLEMDEDDLAQEIDRRALTISRSVSRSDSVNKIFMNLNI